MSRPSTLLFRKLAVKRRVVLEGHTHYADDTPDGTIIDTHSDASRRACPYTLERFLPSRRPQAYPPTLMAEPLRPAVWEVVESYANLDRALPAAKKAKDERFKGAILRVRDRRTGDIIMVDIL